VKFVNYLIGHRKINAGKITFRKPNTSQGNVIDFGVLKITFDKITIGEHSSLKKTTSEIAVGEGAIFKFGVADFFRSKGMVLVFFVVRKIHSQGIFFQK
jgi:hypothetical protein